MSLVAPRVVWLVRHHLDLLDAPGVTKRRLRGSPALADLQRLRRWDVGGRSPHASVISPEAAVALLLPTPPSRRSSTTTMRERIRAERRLLRCSPEPISTATPPPGPSGAPTTRRPRLTMSSASPASAVREAVAASLTDKQREVVEACFFEGVSQGEIARRLGVTQQVVQKRLFGAPRGGRLVGGAIARLREALTPG